MTEIIKERTDFVRSEIEKAKKRSGRNDDVKLIAVTKTFPIEDVKRAYDAGCRDFGENRVQELTEKMDFFPNANWHLIGHLQKNKAKKVVGRVKLIHSADSWELLCEIDKIAKNKNVVQEVLLEVNISGEITKYGLTTDEIKDIMIKIGELGSVKVRGLMTMAPKTDNPEDVRWVFKKAKELFDDLKKDEPSFDVLSMGMSGDYTVAVEEGATAVRVGSLIFGKR